MFHQPETLEVPESKSPYMLPDISNIDSWDLGRLENEFRRIEEERVRLMKAGEREDTPEHPDGRDAKITGEIRELAKIGREIFAKLEEKKSHI